MLSEAINICMSIRIDLCLGGGGVSHSQLKLTQVHDLAYLSRPCRRFPEFAIGDGAGPLRATW